MIETLSGAIYSFIIITGLFGILLILCRDLRNTYRNYSTIENVGLTFICLALVEVIVMLWVEVAIYYIR